MLRSIEWFPFNAGPNRGGAGLLLEVKADFDPHRISMVTGQCWIDDDSFQPTDDDWKWTMDVGKVLNVLLATHGAIIFRWV